MATLVAMSHNLARRVIAAAALTFAAGARGTMQQPAPPPVSACPVADDDQYAFTKEHPVQVGGGPAYGDARQRRYLDALRGPAGQPVRYTRPGSAPGPDGTILDKYEVTSEGLSKPVSLFLDWYHFNPPRAPKGFACGVPMGLGVPPLDPFREADDVRTVATTEGAARAFAPIPLDAEGAANHGVIFDQFRMFARAAHAAAAAGKPLDPKHLPPDVMRLGTVVVVYPLACEGRSILPTAVNFVAMNGAPLPPAAQSPAPDITTLLPGFEPPAGSLAVMFRLAHPRANDSARITYAEPCGAAGDSVTLAMKITAPRGVEMPMPLLPAGAPTDQPVLLQAVVDPDGTMRRISYIGGPAELVTAATEALSHWRSEPARINGVPSAAGGLVQVKFAPPPKD